MESHFHGNMLKRNIRLGRGLPRDQNPPIARAPLQIAAKLPPLPRPPERSRKNRRPHVSGVEDPDCQRVREDRRSRRDGRAERRAEDAGEQSETKQSRGSGILEQSVRSHGAALAVGVCLALPTLPRTRCPDDWGFAFSICRSPQIWGARLFERAWPP